MGTLITCIIAVLQAILPLQSTLIVLSHQKYSDDASCTTVYLDSGAVSWMRSSLSKLQAQLRKPRVKKDHNPFLVVLVLDFLSLMLNYALQSSSLSHGLTLNLWAQQKQSKLFSSPVLILASGHFHLLNKISKWLTKDECWGLLVLSPRNHRKLETSPPNIQFSVLQTLGWSEF